MTYRNFKGLVYNSKKYILSCFPLKSCKILTCNCLQIKFKHLKSKFSFLNPNYFYLTMNNLPFFKLSKKQKRFYFFSQSWLIDILGGIMKCKILWAFMSGKIKILKFGIIFSSSCPQSFQTCRPEKTRRSEDSGNKVVKQQ